MVGIQATGYLAIEMKPRLDDLRIEQTRPLISPAILLEEIPQSSRTARFVLESRQAVEAILRGDDQRLFVVVGPCSVHDPDAVFEFAEKLKPFADEARDRMVIAMRCYFEKPRTTIGWKGFITDPELDGSHRINRGLREARTLLKRIAELELPIATEFLDMTVPQYISDFISWGCIGARTCESQPHRELASGLSMPIGFKNPTDGRLVTAVEALLAAQSQHWFASNTKDGVAAHFRSKGNPSCHIILRGGSKSGPNYHPAHVREAVDLLEAQSLPTRVMIDASHGNSGKVAARQIDVLSSVHAQRSTGSQAIFGLMMESHLVGGRQDLSRRDTLVYGQSITDECLSIDETLEALRCFLD